jgi:hypothetical protein
MPQPDEQANHQLFVCVYGNTHLTRDCDCAPADWSGKAAGSAIGVPTSHPVYPVQPPQQQTEGELDLADQFEKQADKRMRVGYATMGEVFIEDSRALVTRLRAAESTVRELREQARDYEDVIAERNVIEQENVRLRARVAELEPATETAQAARTTGPQDTP